MAGILKQSVLGVTHFGTEAGKWVTTERPVLPLITKNIKNFQAIAIFHSDWLLEIQMLEILYRSSYRDKSFYKKTV